MANRKKRKELYQSSVKAKLGGLDLVSVDADMEYIINAHGAKVYKNASNHPVLEIPQLSSNTDQGTIYQVLSVGIMGRSPIVTVKIGDLTQVYRLPNWYEDWARSLMAMSVSGIKLLPHNIEFGFYVKEKRYYVELI
ncbi:hypothetical protein ASD24_24475 [Paenibacillus sp. Root52]|uniref:hypothetical protein n=1 Tax=Paenibacillus sp. Root52 TaxID=1736552 RepID=UPI0006FF4335|nr:hypothetical protein [Paenibacillus sp. Root52]KQY90955.1 hypothetical protein ASD24_24475 [Paenibacillus sp. Root52]